MKENSLQETAWVPIDDAVSAISTWLIVAAKAFPEAPDNSLLRGFTIPISDINNLYNISQAKGAAYIRAYLSIKDRSNAAATAGLMLVPVDSAGNDIVFADDDVEGKTHIYDFTQPCPAFCNWDGASPLMAPVPIEST